VEQNDRGRAHQSAQLPATWRGAISDLIKEFRVGKGWTQEELGHRSGYDPVYINMLERGRRNPSIRALVDVCQAFGVRPSVFIAEVERRVEPTSGTDYAAGEAHASLDVGRSVHSVSSK
jgi:transcriptional regulator with XRE-family HTH domain